MAALMQSVMDVIRVLRYAQASTSAALYEAAIERNRRGLAKALLAKQQALADLIVNRHQPRNTPPTFLLKRKP